MKPTNVGDIGHIDSPFELKTRFSLGIRCWSVLVAHEFRLLFIGIDILAAEEDSFKEIDMVLLRRKWHHNCQHVSFFLITHTQREEALKREVK
jgi:hypothetical protein